MSSVVKIALPILGAVVGSVIPGLGTALGASLGGAVGGYIGGRSYGGGNKGGLTGAAIGGIGGYFGGGGGLGGLGSTTAQQATEQGLVSGASGGGGSSLFAQAGSGAPFAEQAAGSGSYQGLTEGPLSGYNTTGVTSGDPGAGASFAGGGGSGGGSFLDGLSKLGQGGPVTAGTIRGGLGIASGLASLAPGLGTASDPFSKYRAQYGQQLADLEANPSSITTRPGYQAGLQAVERSGAAQGYTGSGNMAFALSQYGQNAFNQEANRLAALAGAGAPVGQGAVNEYQQQQNAFRGIGSGVGSLIGGMDGGGH